ncbi:PaaI family thioesterase [Rhodobacter sp. SY28-1]|uniref:PaaI family thioesterase n=1 Tax=Rhodobacter sp. SY28-1 TaxID=2562317 RepID=UPI0010BFD2E3|nr:PaaI family thioesterase [Rhodobacter sp. SY28-1]
MQLKMDAAALQAFLAQDFGQVAADFAVERADAAGVVLRMRVAERHLRPGGTVSGPSIFALADVAMYLAILSRIGPVALTVTTNCAIDFLRKPAAGQDLRGEARVLKLGRSLAVGDVLVFSDGMADPVARASLTYSIPPSARAGS